ncbi:3-oxoacid CoA-transferase, B subunit [Emticicia oligotrophica DSM 17448]|uniref:3-oxoacid CoA-transferase n=1 Tax=Emticicia oligotrophica (strain DSM 17448 / CIP 109782 / MTCC 6937 / GPTSA100-15) TaxID=929562 RepID=A0ABM5N4B9_EMTOG|nr:3-oxoacid CoA-transferase, B subunit [Emticicia oligotrophica DSM 17448]
MINKVISGADEAVADIPNGATLMLGGFGLCGIPENSIAALLRKGVKDLTCISNNAGVDDFGIGLMLKTRQVKKMISSYVGENKEFERQLLSGELEVELTPQGTLAERIRAGGAGIPAFFTPAGVGTEVAEGKEIQEFDGKMYVRESWLKADFAIVKAWKGDTAGNLIFKGTAQNFSPMMAAAGKITIAEVEELVPAGSLDPAQIHTPGIYVQRIFQGKNYEKRIEQRTISQPQAEKEQTTSAIQVNTGLGLDKNQIAKRIAREVKDGYYVNLGIGIPTLVANYIPEGINVVLQSENGLLGIGPFPTEDKVDPDLINAGKQTVTLLDGSALFSSAESFAMIRGGHVDLTILGAMEVSENGDIANWKIPGKMVKGMGGAMDLVASAENIIVAMQHVNKAGESKLLKSCTLPITGLRCVKKIVTELAVLEVVPEGGFKLLERAPGISVEQIVAATEGNLIIEGEIPEMEL